LIGIIGQISIYLDKILIFHYAGGVALAIYYLALIPFKQIQSILGSLNILALPKFSTSEIKTLKLTLPPKILKFYLIIIPIIIIYILAAPYFFKIFYPQYMRSIFISQLFILLLLLFPLNVFSAVLTAQSQTSKLYISSVTYAIIRILLLLILVPWFGIYGAVGTILTSNLLISILNTYFFFRMT
jgi:O-antigen/teichoic acid export membrane protein